LIAISGMTIVTTLSAIRILFQAYLDVDTNSTTDMGGEDEMSKIHRLYKAIMTFKLTFLFGTFTLLCAWSLTSLLMFHAMIISIAQTTNERVRNVYRANSHGFSLCGKSSQQQQQQQQEGQDPSITGADNEADLGCCPNWYRAFCSPVPVSRLPSDMSATVVCQYAATTGEETVWTGGDATTTTATGDETTTATGAATPRSSA
jgi:hypothetical protein